MGLQWYDLQRGGFGLETGLFTRLTTKTNYDKSSTVVTAYITFKAHSIFTFLELVFLQTSQLPWPIQLTSVRSCSNTFTKSRCNWNSWPVIPLGPTRPSTPLELWLSWTLELKQLRMYRKENIHFYKSCFFRLCVTVGMCLNKPVTK
jgi:hypothetical protein